MPQSFQQFIQIIFIAFTWGLGYFSMPHILTKFMGIDKAKNLRKSKYVGITWQITVLTAATIVGLIGIAYFATGLANKELIFIEMVKNVFHPFIAGFMLCAILAAGLSTIDSQVLVLASVLTEDLYSNIHKKHTPQQLLWFYRFSILVIALISCLIALRQTTTIQQLVKYAWVGLSCSFGPVVLSALYYKKANKWAALAGITSGGIISALWEFLAPHITFVGQPIPAVVPGFFSSIFLIILISEYMHKRS